MHVEVEQASVPGGKNHIVTRRIAEDGPWFRQYDSGRYSGIISIGSPHVSAASERLLCDLLGVETPHEKLGISRHLPVRYCFDTGDSSVDPSIPSAFELSRAESDQMAGRPAKKHHSRMWCGGRLFECSKTGDLYGLIVFRQTGSQIHIVASGMTGPATEAAVRCLPLIPDDWFEKSDHDNVTGIVVVRASCSERASGGAARFGGDRRDLDPSSIGIESDPIWV